ncbi:MAG: hypothetical protein HN576_09875 [Bacteriovoracaceae bacterium]|jgi:ectoine hydroxylase-related dioxygenase (phytanoyl-CoA dioxygenase family)|nr:hypothetical protein [Bacteriovoracaceae bacterium]
MADNEDQIYSLSDDQKRSYQTDGFLIVPNLVSMEYCDKLISDATDFAKDEIHNYLNFHRDIDSFRSLITKERILDIADQLQNARMVPIGSIFFFGKPNNPLENGSLTHQDNYAAKAPSGSYFVVALALDDCDEFNGALTVYPGSHTLGELPYTVTKNFEFDENGKMIKNFPIGNEVQIPDGHSPITLKYFKGSVIFMHSNTIHSASKNINQEGMWRKKIYMHYVKDGDPFWPGWNAKRQIIDRGPRRI